MMVIGSGEACLHRTSLPFRHRPKVGNTLAQERVLLTQGFGPLDAGGNTSRAP